MELGAIDQNQLDAWLARLGGPRFRGFDDLEQVIAEMRAVGTDALFPLIVPMVNSDDFEIRCKACDALMRLDPKQGVAFVLPLLGDVDAVVRLCACGCLGQFGDERAVAPLVQVLKCDEDTQVRGTAAWALGEVGGPAAIPALLGALANDLETDMHGHSPSWCAAMALDKILGTEETCLRFGNVCRMLGREPDLDRLRHLAEVRYEQWSAGRS